MNRMFRKSVLLATTLVLASAAAASAQTAPGVLVTSTVSLSYNSGATTPTVTVPNAAEVEFRVDRKIDVIVASVPAGGIVIAQPGMAGVVLAYEVTNEGNDTQGYVLQVGDGGTIGGVGLDYSATATTDPGQYYVMTSPTQNPADGTVYDTGAADLAFDLAPGAARYVLIVANLPIGAVDQQFDDFVLRAITTEEGTTTEVVEDRDPDMMEISTVFADAARLSTRTNTQIDPELDGRSADEIRLDINAPQLSVTLEVEVLDEGLPGTGFVCATGGAATGSPLAAIPGACLEYTIVVTNAEDATTAATDITISNVIPGETTFAAVDQGGFTSAAYDAIERRVTATLAELNTDSSAEFRIRVIVD
jgi:uncharacterized repeat protein (TIGR01451 family)